MRVIEHSQNRLILQSLPSRWMLLFISFFATLVGSFFLLLGLVLQQSEHAGVIPIGMGIILIISIPVFAVKLSKANRLTFDTSNDLVLWEQYSVWKRSSVSSVKFPAHLIIGVELISSFMDTEGRASYYAQLLLASVYWRIPLGPSGRYENVVMLAKTISQFLNIEYFPDNSKAPIPTWRQKALRNAEPWKPHWQYFESETERLQRHIEQYPQDAEAHQDLGISLYRSNRMNRKKAINALEQAEKLFETQKDEDRAAVAKVIQAAICWGY
jgi:hypothetical protein